MPGVGIVDTTLRDGQQSLWACGMSTAAMAPAISDLDAAGYDAAEFTVPSIFFPKAVQEREEYPWDWIKIGVDSVSKTQLRLHGGSGARFNHIPQSIRDLFISKLVGSGIDVTRTSDPWNDFQALQGIVDDLASKGMRTVVNLVYSVSPRHTVRYFVEKVHEAAAINPYRVCFKDVGGLLTPEVARELLPMAREAAGGIPLEFHAHSSNSFSHYNCIIAAESGFDFIHTAIPPLAEGPALPSVLRVVPNLRARGFDVDLDLEPVERMAAHFAYVAEVEHHDIGMPVAYDESLYMHQIPGGMISNLKHQLREIGLEGRLEDVLIEVARVRADLGYPIMVTPLAQFVGSQAVLNVATGERYGAVTDELILYAMGRFGEEAVDVMDATLRSDIIGRSRAEELSQGGSVGEPSLGEVMDRFGGLMSEEELLVRAYSGVYSGSLGHLYRGPYPSSYREYRDSYGDLVSLIRNLDHLQGPLSMFVLENGAAFSASI